MVPELDQGRLKAVSLGLARLTATERTVLSHLLHGRTHADIGTRLGVSTRTAEAHAHSINRKLSVRHFSEAVMYVLAIRWNVVEPPSPEPLPEPAAAVTESKLTCLECGRSMSLLGTHLWRHHDMAPADYIAKHSLPASYPMIAAATRRQRQRQAAKADLKNSPQRRASRRAQ